MREEKEIVFRVLVQLGAFLDKARAEQFKKTIDSQSRLTHLRTSKINKRIYYKIFEQMGSYGELKKANQQVATLRKSGKLASVEKAEIIRKVPELKGKVIVIDPGHGGSAAGAIGPNGALEKDMNLQVALLTKKLLLAEGATVRLTRETDTSVSLYARPELANSLKANLFLSIHMDGSTNQAARGTLVIYGKSPGSYDLATLMQKNFRAVLGLNNRGILLDSRGLAVLRRAKVPAALVEMAFITNPQEEKLFRGEATRQKAAQAIFRGCLDFCNSH